MNFNSRQQALRRQMERQRLSILFVSRPANLFYLTGFRGSAGAAIFRAGDGTLFVDPRYTLQAREQAEGVEVVESKHGLLQGAARVLSNARACRAGFDDAHLTVAEMRALRKGAGKRIKWVPSGGLVEELRAVKDSDEIGLIRQAGRLTAEVFGEVLHLVRPGVREADLAAEVEYRMRREGAEGTAFETIIASGPRSALPHARASDKLLKEGEWVILDLGGILGGYAADMTRTVFLGRPGRRARACYEAVRSAQEAALRAIREGARAQEGDARARQALKRWRLNRYFTHSTGHGVGIDIHERPRLGKGEKTILKAGNVVTAEPGVYLKGLGGVRIEDTVLVGMGEPEILTPASKDGWCVE